MIALIHAVYPAMAPVEAAFKRLWPDQARFNLVDDGLAPALEHAGSLTPKIQARILGLAEHAHRCGATAALFTCSAFGPAIEAAALALPIPVLKPNEAMFVSALKAGTRLGMIATFAPSVPSMTQEFESMAAQAGLNARLETLCVPQAMQAARRGDIALHDELVAQASPQLAHCDAILLAQFSTSTAKSRVQALCKQPVLAAPEEAVLRVKALLAH